MKNMRSLDIVHKLFSKHFSNQREVTFLYNLLRHSLSHNTFTFFGRNYIQTNGCAMGKAYSPTLANLYMEEIDIFFSTNPLVKFYIRYIDDIFILWDDDVDSFQPCLETANIVIPGIELTVEAKKQSINFLDITVYKNNSGSLNYLTYFKSTNFFQYLHPSSITYL